MRESSLSTRSRFFKVQEIFISSPSCRNILSYIFPTLWEAAGSNINRGALAELHYQRVEVFHLISRIAKHFRRETIKISRALRRFLVFSLLISHCSLFFARPLVTRLSSELIECSSGIMWDQFFAASFLLVPCFWQGLRSRFYSIALNYLCQLISSGRFTIGRNGQSFGDHSCATPLWGFEANGFNLVDALCHGSTYCGALKGVNLY